MAPYGRLNQQTARVAVHTARMGGSVFISYSHKDADLILGEIRPLLKAAPQLTVILDVDDFEWGKDPKGNMERAAQTCSHTFAVITQHYIDSEWTTLEAMTALDLERLIPLVFQMPSVIPTKIGSRASYGLALDPLEWDDKFRRLLGCLKLTPSEIDTALAARPLRNRQCLRARAKHPLAQKQREEFEAVLENAWPSYRKLKAAKKLHDRIHAAQSSFQVVRETMLELLAALGRGSDPRELDRLWESLKRRANELDMKLQSVLREARRWYGDQRTQGWELDLEEAAQNLGSAIAEREPDDLKRAMEQIRDPLLRQPTSLNETIFAERERLAIEQLCAPLALFKQYPTAVAYEASVAKVVRRFTDAFDHFKDIGERVLRLIANHDRLQAIEDQCAGLDETPKPSAKEIQRLWKRVSEHVRNLDETDVRASVASLRLSATQLEDRILQGPALRAGGTEPSQDEIAKWLSDLQAAYGEFRTEVSRTFHVTDDELRDQSESLPDALTELQESLEVLNE